MQLKVWTPLFDIEKEVKSIFDRMLMPTGDDSTFDFRPTVDVVHDEGVLTVSVELPGIDPDKDVEITLENDMLTVKGEKSMEKEVKEEHRYLHERRYGSFMRRIPLPDGVSEDDITAGYEKGVLTVTVELPKEEEPVRRTIKIT